MRFFARTVCVGSLLLTELALASPGPFNFGPYRLGMDNSDAKRFGLGTCSPDSEEVAHVACDVTSELQALVGSVHKATIAFSAKTKVLTRIDVSLKDGDLAETMQRLKIQACPKEWAHNWDNLGNTGWCYRLPNQTRHIQIETPCKWRSCSKSIFIKFRARFDSKHVQDFVRARNASQLHERQSKVIQSGK